MQIIGLTLGEFFQQATLVKVDEYGNSYYELDGITYVFEEKESYQGHFWIYNTLDLNEVIASTDGLLDHYEIYEGILA